MDRRDAELFELARGVVEDAGYTLVRVDDVVDRGRRVFRFYIDHPRGVMLGDCEAVSRELGYLLDGSFDFEGAYVLEVSSPGLDHDLRLASEFEHFMGRAARLVLREPVGGRNVLAGVLAGGGPGAVSLRLGDGSEISVPLSNIARARLTDDSPGRGRSRDAQEDGRQGRQR
jgi:ribosome maturation factor RimP